MKKNIFYSFVLFQLLSTAVLASYISGTATVYCTGTSVEIIVDAHLSGFGTPTHPNDEYQIEWYVEQRDTWEVFLHTFPADTYTFEEYPQESKSFTAEYGGPIFVRIEITGPDDSTTGTIFAYATVPGSADVNVTSGPTFSTSDSYNPITISGMVKNEGDAPPSAGGIYVCTVNNGTEYYLGAETFFPTQLIPSDSMSYSVTSTVGLPGGSNTIRIYHDSELIQSSYKYINPWDIQLDESPTYANWSSSYTPTVTVALKNNGDGTYPGNYIGVLIYDASENLYSEGWQLMYAKDSGDPVEEFDITVDTGLVQGWNYVGIWDQAAYNDGLDPWIGGEWKYVY